MLPVSNLTNLLAFSASGLSFGAFAKSMSLPWVIACVLEFAALWWFFRADLRLAPNRTANACRSPATDSSCSPSPSPGSWRRRAWVCRRRGPRAAGVILLAAPHFRPRDLPKLIKEANVGFCLFVLTLGIIVDAVTRHGLGSALGHVLPDGTSLVELLGLAFLAALAANVVNNLPATLLFVPLVAGHPVALLAVLLGVNIGPNATYGGSLATLLWRRLLPAEERPKAGQFHLYGVLTVPVILAACTAGLWAVS